MTETELQEKFDYFKRMFNTQRDAKYEYEYRTGCWRFYYTLVRREGYIETSYNKHIEVEKLDNPEKEFKQLFRRFKTNLCKNEGIEWFVNSLITKQMFNKYKISNIK